MPTVQSVSRGTANLAGTLGADRQVRSVSDQIFLLEANAMPLTALSRAVGKIAVPSIKREYFEDEKFPETVTCITTAQTTTDTTISVATPGGNYVAVGDLLWSEATDEVMRVHTATSATAFSVERGFGASTAATIAGSQVLQRIGNAMSQGSNTPTYKQTLEVMRTNYIQRFRKSFSIAKEVANSNLYGEQQLAYQKRKTLLELMREVEFANFFGTANAGDGLVEISTASSRDPAACGGIREFLTDNAPSALKYDASEGALAEANFLGVIRDTYINRGPHQPGKKVLFAAPPVITDLETIMSNDLRIGLTDFKSGVKAKEWQTSFGDIMIISHPLLTDPSGGGNNFAFLLDMQEIKQVVQSGMDLEYKERNLEDTTGQEIIVGEWKISQCLEIKGSGGVHAMIEGVAA